MVNDEVNNKAINIEIKVAQYSAKAILKAMKKIIEDAAEKSQPLADYLSEKRKTNSRKLKDMVKKGQLENIDLQKGEVKELKNQLNLYGVNFSIMNNKESKYSDHFPYDIQKTDMVIAAAHFDLLVKEKTIR